MVPLGDEEMPENMFCGRDNWIFIARKNRLTAYQVLEYPLKTYPIIQVWRFEAGSTISRITFDGARHILFLKLIDQSFKILELDVNEKLFRLTSGTPQTNKLLLKERSGSKQSIDLAYHEVPKPPTLQNLLEVGQLTQDNQTGKFNYSLNMSIQGHPIWSILTEDGSKLPQSVQITNRFTRLADESIDDIKENVVVDLMTFKNYTIYIVKNTTLGTSKVCFKTIVDNKQKLLENIGSFSDPRLIFLTSQPLLAGTNDTIVRFSLISHMHNGHSRMHHFFWNQSKPEYINFKGANNLVLSHESHIQMHTVLGYASFKVIYKYTILFHSKGRDQIGIYNIESESYRDYEPNYLPIKAAGFGVSEWSVDDKSESAKAVLILGIDGKLWYSKNISTLTPQSTFSEVESPAKLLSIGDQWALDEDGRLWVFQADSSGQIVWRSKYVRGFEGGKLTSVLFISKIDTRISFIASGYRVFTNESAVYRSPTLMYFDEDSHYHNGGLDQNFIVTKDIELDSRLVRLENGDVSMVTSTGKIARFSLSPLMISFNNADPIEVGGIKLVIRSDTATISNVSQLLQLTKKKEKPDIEPDDKSKDKKDEQKTTSPFKSFILILVLVVVALSLVILVLYLKQAGIIGRKNRTSEHENYTSKDDLATDTLNQENQTINNAEKEDSINQAEL